MCVAVICVSGRVKWVQLLQNKAKYEKMIVEEKRRAAGEEIVLEPEETALNGSTNQQNSAANVAQ